MSEGRDADEHRLLDGNRELRTSVGYSESETGEPHVRIPDSGESFTGGKEEISGDCIWRGGKLNKDVREIV